MRMTTSELIHAAYHAARYLPKASSQLVRELADRLDTTKSALCESLKIRDALAAENLALKEATKNGEVEKHQQTSNGTTIGVKNVIVQREIETPTTDAWVNEQRALGVEMFALMYAEEAIKSNNITTGWRARASREASQYAEQLRGSQS
ncbi:hypothetical protein [Atlantibacter hermannii]|uniref:Uncharacterized protein n=1 Tax=Atlantibacter hermannii NBRC 105704 TaxID=1115512 RepID=H5UYZ7_ATLHE|nr:hypothetical protein [Atlantibacter hermannii]QPS90098.1 hypothetical protein I6G45_10995 [Atlantibacter hermannii]GAB50151.1 hypothetical protein EH105704_01_01560 [Atlantibacter hermannii NBRC 105704]VDZ73089.1 Uncharacterised protein [Atlantibacter hermannii]